MKGAKEFTGRSLDDAIAAACKYYDLPREKLEVEIVNDAKTGIFGLVGAKKATIMAKQALVKNFDFEGKEEKNHDRSKASDKTASNAAGSVLAKDSAKAHDRSSENSDPSAKSRPQFDSVPNSLPSAQDEAEAGAKSSGMLEKTDQQSQAPQANQVNRSERSGRNPRARQSASSSGKDSRREGSPVRNENLAAQPDLKDASGQRQESSDSKTSRDNRSGSNAPSNFEARDPKFAVRPDGGRNRQDRSRSPREGGENRRDDSRRQARDGRNFTATTPDSSGSLSSRSESLQQDSFKANVQAGYPSSTPNQYEQSNNLNNLDAEQALDFSAQFSDLNDDFEPSQAAQNFANLDKDKACELVKYSLDKMISAICPDADIAVGVGDGRITASIDCGEASGLLIGREGQTLSALQYMVSRIISRQMEAAVHVHLDTGDYKERQDRKLQDISLRLAARARETGRTQYTRPLSSYHRRIVHMVLQGEQGIETRSKGEGSMKRVYIFTRSN